MSNGVELSAEENRVIPVALSSASVYPLSVHDAFAVAQDLGFDGVEVMVTNNATSQSPHSLLELSHRYRQPIVSIHAPTLLLTQKVWGSAWNKIEMSCRMAREVGCGTVVVHPPFRWQSNYAENFPAGIRQLADMYQVRIAVENMYPWRVRGRDTVAYLPHWDPLGQDYDDVTWDDATREQALKKGTQRAIDDAEARGTLPGWVAAVLRFTADHAPVGWILDRLPI